MGVVKATLSQFHCLLYVYKAGWVPGLVYEESRPHRDSTPGRSNP